MSHQIPASASAPMFAAAAAGPLDDDTALDRAFAALKSYDYGSSRAVLLPIDDAVVGAVGDPASSQALELRFIAVLQSDAPPVAKTYVCGKLALLGSTAAVPSLAALLFQPELSHAARNALQVIPAREAGHPLRAGSSKRRGPERIGLIHSLGMRRDLDSTTELIALLEDSDAPVAGAAAAALGDLGTRQAAQALEQFHSQAPNDLRLIVADARLACAEQFLRNGEKTAALDIYRALAGAQHPKQVQLAARRGLLTAAQKD